MKLKDSLLPTPDIQSLNALKNVWKLGMIAHACNPSYSGDEYWENHS
jgi:hypothetical protein